MPLQNCVQWNEHCPHRSGILSATFDHYRWLLQPALNLHVYLPFLRTGAIVNGYMPLSKWIPWPSFGVTFGNFWPLSLNTSTCVSLHRDLYHYLERALSPTCEHYNVNGHRRPTLSFRVLSVTFDHYRWLLRLALIFIINLLLITSNARYCKHLNVFASFAQNPPPVNLERVSSFHHDVVNQIYTEWCIFF